MGWNRSDVTRASRERTERPLHPPLHPEAPTGGAKFGIRRLDLKTPRGVGSNHVIAYILWQGWDRRVLTPEDHDKLVWELYALRDAHGG